MLLYYMLGLVGLPVFAADAGGAGAALSASAGYLFGFFLAQYPAAAAWRLVGKGRTGLLRTWARSSASVVVANLVIFGVGLVWLHAYLNASWSETLAKGLWPFLAGDAIKSASAIVIGVLATRAGMSRV
jgi:biotin transport system substrate-specific component